MTDSTPQVPAEVASAISQELFLGIDVGTGSTKAVLANAAGDIVAVRLRSHDVSLPGPGLAEFDAEGTWWRELCELSLELVAEFGAQAIKAVTVSGLGPCMLVTDAQFTPLRPAILYGIDTRAVPLLPELAQRLGGENEIFGRCGKHLSSQAAGAKLEWIRVHEPEVYAKTAYWFNSSSYLTAKLSGEYMLDHHTASQCDPFYDVHEQAWIPEWAQQISGHIPLPKLLWPGEIAGALTAEAASATGLLEGTIVGTGTVDAWAEAHSAGVAQPGDLMLMYGSTMFMVQVLDKFSSHEKLWTTSGVTPGSRTLAAGMATSGSVTTWLQQLTGNVDFGTLIAEAEAIPAGSDGLVMLPYFQGERTPIFDAQASGTVLGLTLRHGRGHLLRASYEGIACGIRQIIEFLHASSPVRRVFAVGGGTQSVLWTQIVSDISGRSQIVPEQAVGAAYGDALWSAMAYGAVPADTVWAKAGTVVEPDPARSAAYEDLYSVYAGLYPKLRDDMHALAALAERNRAGQH